MDLHRPATGWPRERRGRRIRSRRRRILQPPCLSRRCSGSGSPDDRGSVSGDCGSAGDDDGNHSSHGDVCNKLPPSPTQLDDGIRRLGIRDFLLEFFLLEKNVFVGEYLNIAASEILFLLVVVLAWPPTKMIFTGTLY
ncbi:hypothetical protein EE612_012702 [Oryza sativa]|nr:hypothetical protein EE612_012702 [Oryza sativa]